MIQTNLVNKIKELKGRLEVLESFEPVDLEVKLWKSSKPQPIADILTDDLRDFAIRLHAYTTSASALNLADTWYDGQPASLLLSHVKAHYAYVSAKAKASRIETRIAKLWKYVSVDKKAAYALEVDAEEEDL